jgi:peptide/nickel transport system substrate-binding protein
LLYSTLLHEDANGVFTPDVAAVVPTQANGGISRDGLRVRFKLRRNIRWSDGAKLTADDVAFTLAALTNPANNTTDVQNLTALKSALAVDRYTLSVRLKYRYAPILESLNVAILPRHLLANARSLNDQAFNGHPVGSGPYELKKWLRNDRIELVANPFYSGTQPAIHEIDLVSTPNDETALSLLRAGSVDGSFGIDPALLPQLRGLSQYRILTGSAASIRAFTFNMHDPILKSRAVRHAFASAIDLGPIVNRATRGAFGARDAALPIFRWAYDPSARYSEYNVRRSEKLLDEAGWHRNSSGERYRNGKRLDIEIDYMNGQPSNEEVVTQVQAQLTTVGMSVTLHGFSPTQFYSMQGPTTSGRAQVVYWGILELIDPDQSFFLSCTMLLPDGANIMHYCNKSVDAANAAALDTYDRGRRVVLYHFVQHILTEDLPFIPVYASRDYDVVTNRLRGLNVGFQADPFQDVANWSFR